MILHIMKDEKFMDGAHRIFEMVAPGHNEYVVVSSKKKIINIKTFRPDVISYSTCFGTAFLAGLRSYKVVFIHSLHLSARCLLRLSPDSVNFVWLGWGGDYYRIMFPDSCHFLLPQTLVLSRGLSSFNLINRGLLKLHIFDYFLSKNTKRKQRAQRAGWCFNAVFSIKQTTANFFKGTACYLGRELSVINRKINFFAPVLYEDYQLMVKHVPAFKPVYLSWNYGNTAKLIDRLGSISVKSIRRNILFGNSAFMTNNHLDAFTYLKQINLNQRQIFCPLNYGNPVYAKIIRQEGERTFGRKFQVLDTFLPLDEYMEILSSCSIVIMNHMRQQAVANINAALLFGAMVFLRKENTYYRFLRREGAVIFALDDLETVLPEYEKGLTREQIHHNQDVVRRNFGDNAVLQKTEIMLDTVGYHK